MMNRPTTHRDLPAGFAILLSLLGATGVFASQKAIPDELSDAQISNLVATGKVWGYLKYHHPTITQGCIDWDYELMSMLPEVLEIAIREILGDGASDSGIRSLAAFPQ